MLERTGMQDITPRAPTRASSAAASPGISPRPRCPAVRARRALLAAIALSAACTGAPASADRPAVARTRSPLGAHGDSAAAAPTAAAAESAAVAARFAAQIVEKRRTDAAFAAALGGRMLVRKIAYAGAGGLTIPAYLFAPRDTTVRRPTVLFVHGGVHGDFGLAHLAQVRALVRRGYVVVAPEYRGSAGYGARFYALLDYGGLEVDDVVAARGYLARFAPYADLDRLAVMGYSHGGYIALFAVLRHPTYFRAAVAHVPVADLPTRMRTHPPWYERLFVAQPAFGAPLAERPGPYVARSPSAHARALARPVLVHAADNDADVHIAENRVLRDSMRAAGMVSRGLYRYREWHDPPGGHAFGVLATPEGRASWAETVAFLDRHVARPRAAAHQRPRTRPSPARASAANRRTSGSPRAHDAATNP
jgi:dipeptidyl aminopeptidase/acylaminoacyl peptidase